MIDRFQGERGKKVLLSALITQKIVAGSEACAFEIIERGELLEYKPGEAIIIQGDENNDVYLIITGVCTVDVNGRIANRRRAGDHVGEMAAIQPTQVRAASIFAEETVIAIRLSEDVFNTLGERYPIIYKEIAKELAKRLLDRNKTIGLYRESIRIFIICSVEALPIARAIETAFEHDNIFVELWNEGCFKVSNYTLQDLEAAVDRSDFAIAIAHADDSLAYRKATWPVPRDNVIFELGLFMGRLGRSRAILMEPRDLDVKLPSDLAGITTISYRFSEGSDTQSIIGPACNKLRNYINELGPHNG